MSRRRQLSAEGGAVFEEGISLVLSRWSALQIALNNDFAGRDSRHFPLQLASHIFSFFTLSIEPLYIDDLEERLDEFMLTLNTEIDDGSIEEVAEKLMIMHEECLECNYRSIQSLKDNPPPGGVVHIRQEAKDEDDESEEENESSEMAIDTSKSHSHKKNSNEDMMIDGKKSDEPAEIDGWTVVASRRNKGRKN